MRNFYLNRANDVSGVSGTGRVAQGTVFDNGKVAMCWISNLSSVAVYDNIQDVERIHGHNGATQVEYEPDYKQELRQVKENYDSATKWVDELQDEIDDLRLRVDGLE